MSKTTVGLRISSGDACLLLNGWDDSLALISCDARIGNTSFSMTGRMRNVQELSKIRLISDDGHGEFSFELKNLGPNRDYEYRGCVRHPLITMYGQERTFHASR